jgi:hypothetical protein
MKRETKSIDHRKREKVRDIGNYTDDVLTSGSVAGDSVFVIRKYLMMGTRAQMPALCSADGLPLCYLFSSGAGVFSSGIGNFFRSPAVPPS